MQMQGSPLISSEPTAYSTPAPNMSASSGGAMTPRARSPSPTQLQGHVQQQAQQQQQLHLHHQAKPQGQAHALMPNSTVLPLTPRAGSSTRLQGAMLSSVSASSGRAVTPRTRTPTRVHSQMGQQLRGQYQFQQGQPHIPASSDLSVACGNMSPSSSRATTPHHMRALGHMHGQLQMTVSTDLSSGRVATPRMSCQTPDQSQIRKQQATLQPQAQPQSSAGRSASSGRMTTPCFQGLEQPPPQEPVAQVQDQTQLQQSRQQQQEMMSSGKLSL